MEEEEEEEKEKEGGGLACKAPHVGGAGPGSSKRVLQSSIKGKNRSSDNGKSISQEGIR